MDSLLFEQWTEDEDVKRAKKALLKRFFTLQSKLNQVRPPLKSKQVEYASLLDQLSTFRGVDLWYRYLGSGLGNGALVELCDGSVKYDCISGLGTHWGHGHKTIVESQLEAAFEDIVMQGNLQQNRIALEVEKTFCDLSGFDHCFLSTSGAMACENALKLAFQKRNPAKRILAFEHCFMGRTLAMASITDKPAYRQGLPTTLTVDYLPFYDTTDHKGSIKKSVAKLKEYLCRYPDDHAALCLELVQGEGGYFVGHTEFFKALIAEAKAAGIIVIVDEVQSFGRTYQPFAFQHFKLEEHIDCVTVGKLTQVCATLFKDSLKPKPGLLSQTFIGSTSALYAAKAILNDLKTGDYFGNTGKNHKVHTRFIRKLKALKTRYPSAIEGPFGMGNMIAMTLFKGKKEPNEAFSRALFDAGLICFLAGANPTRLRMTFPMGGLRLKDIDPIFAIFESTFKTFHASLGD